MNKVKNDTYWSRLKSHPGLKLGVILPIYNAIETVAREMGVNLEGE